MQAVIVEAPGGPEQLRVDSVPDPTPAAHELLIEVHATALNRADLLQRRGLYPPPAGTSSILGLECAGVVVDAGREVTLFRKGDRVMALLGGGGYAELACVHEQQALPIPERLGFVEAAAVPEAFLTAYQALFRRAELAPGERLLVHAAASGVGLAAVAIARELGAFVFATVRSRAKAAALEALGVERVIVAGEKDFWEVVREQSRGAGADVILDLVGAAYSEQNQDALAVAGRWVVVGLVGGARANLDFGKLLMRRQTLMGIVMRSLPLPEKSAIVSGFSRDLWPWLADGRLRPVVDSEFSLSEVRGAHERMEKNLNAGKIVLRVR
jgi:putative PIG3 family NAD(P)H quinone oxidoreductase